MVRRKVILQLIESWDAGGAETVVLELCRRLDKRFFYPMAVVRSDGWLNQQLLKNGIETMILKDKYSCDPLFLKRLISIINERNVSIIHSHEFITNIYGTMAAVLTKKPIITTIHGKEYYWKKLRRRVAYRLMSYFAKYVIAVSEHQKKFICDTTGINPNRISVIYNGVDLETFNGDYYKVTEKVNNKNGMVVSGFPVIGAIGNFYPVKGHMYLIRSAPRIIREFPEATFLMVGKTTKYLDELQKEVSKLNLEKNFKFLSFQENIPSLLQLMDIFVLPSIQETFSIATVEAMAACKPVIATKCGGPEEIVIDGETGFLVPPMDPEALAEKSLTLLANKELAYKMGNAGRKRVEEMFTVENMVRRYQSLYE